MRERFPLLFLALVTFSLMAPAAWAAPATEAEFFSGTITCRLMVEPYHTNHCRAWVRGTAAIRSCDQTTCDVALQISGQGEGWAATAPRLKITTSLGGVCMAGALPAARGIVACDDEVVLTVPAAVGELTTLWIAAQYSDAPHGHVIAHALALTAVSFVNDGDGSGHFPVGDGPRPQLMLRP